MIEETIKLNAWSAGNTEERMRRNALNVLHVKLFYEWKDDRLLMGTKIAFSCLFRSANFKLNKFFEKVCYRWIV